MKAFTTGPADCVPIDPRKFDVRTACALFEHAAAVYDPTYPTEAERAGFGRGVMITRGAAQAGVAVSSKAIVVSIRGSDEPADWFWNLMSSFRMGLPWLPKRATLGLGFRRQVRKLAPEVVRRVSNFRALASRAKVIVTGHSLGAAQVGPLVAYLDRCGIPVELAYAFESPRPGCAGFADHYDRTHTYNKTPTFHVVNTDKGERDIVTRVPFYRDGARHIGKQVLIFDGMYMEGRDAWHNHRARFPVGRIEGWRVLTRAGASIRAHLRFGLRAKLRNMRKARA